MSKQVYARRVWYDCAFIQQCNDEDKFLVVYEHDGIPNSFYADSSLIRDKPKEEEVEEIGSVDWTKPLQIKCGGGRHWEQVWADVVFHKRYGDVIALIFEQEGEPIYITENAKDFNLTIRNRPLTCTFERWVVYIDNVLYEVCLSEGDAKGCLNFKRQTSGKPGYIKHIKVEWEL